MRVIEEWRGKRSCGKWWKGGMADELWRMRGGKGGRLECRKRGGKE